MCFASVLMLFPSSFFNSSAIAMIFASVIDLSRERRSRPHVGYLGRYALVDPSESPAMMVIKYGDDRAMKKFLTLSRGLFEFVLQDFGVRLGRVAGRRGRPHSLDNAMVLALALYYMASVGGYVGGDCCVVLYVLATVACAVQVEEPSACIRCHPEYTLSRFEARLAHVPRCAAARSPRAGSHRSSAPR